MTNCPHCGAPAPVVDGRCAACNAVVDPTGPRDGGAPPDDQAATMAGLPPASDPTQWPPDSVTRRGVYAEAPTDAGLVDEAPTHTGQTHAPGAPGGPGKSGPLKPGERFGPRYHIVKILGMGGMGAVYQAWDTELGVVVAMKVIRPEIAADPRAAAMLERRFKQELLLARKVTHKNVVRIHDIGEIDGIKFITMPFIEGEELASIIQRQDRIPIDRVMTMARGIATGLEAAHAAGVVHRDLKPANIMIDKADEALIMDFGIARSTGGPNPSAPGGPGHLRASANWSANQTMAGAVVGTVQYMAPEQARGEAVDQRADIYAFGLIVYDMLLNKQRSRGTDTAIAELEGRMQAPPPAPRTIDPSVPIPLERLVMRCVQPDPAQRFQTTADLVAALNRLDSRGQLLPVLRRVTRPMMAGVAAVFLAGLGLTWWLARGPAIPVEHDPVAVLIADFQNQTGDPTFDRTLEPILRLALEGAGFINAYDRSSIPRGLGVPAPEVLDDRAALELAVKQGVGVVLAGALTQDGSRYRVSVTATEAVTGNVITTARGTASGKEAVLGVATNLAGDVREALGDDMSDSAQRFAMETLSAASLPVVREYASAMEALSRSQFSTALEGFSKAVALDENFGLAYAGMAIASSNLGRQQDAERYVQDAIRLVDGMTERERYRTRGLFYLLTSDYQACVKEYGDLIARYSADAAARNNRALCLSKLRDMPTALEEMRQVVRILPNRALYRVNLATYAAYGGDAQAAEQEALKARDQSPWALQSLALAQTLQGQPAAARQTYEELGRTQQLGPSYTGSGLADLAIYEGHYAEAARLLADGAAADLEAKDPDRAANKYAALAYAELMRTRKAAAIAAADKALASSQAMTIRFLAARVLVEAGAPERAAPIAASLAKELQAEPQAYAAIIRGLTSLAAGEVRDAIRLLTEANGHLDTWIGHFDLGRAYLAADAFPQADSEFDRCLSRRGEALALFLDEEPTFGYFPPVYYYQGRVREGLKSAGYAESYRTYLAIRGTSTDDPLVEDVRKRLGS